MGAIVFITSFFLVEGLEFFIFIGLAFLGYGAMKLTYAYLKKPKKEEKKVDLGANTNSNQVVNTNNPQGNLPNNNHPHHTHHAHQARHHDQGKAYHQPLYCRRCGNKVAITDNFCSKCGVKIH